MSTTATSADLVERLSELETERALAAETGLVNEPRYMDDLRDEIKSCREAYVGVSVVEIALRRAARRGRLQG